MHKTQLERKLNIEWVKTQIQLTGAKLINLQKFLLYASIERGFSTYRTLEYLKCLDGLDVIALNIKANTIIKTEIDYTHLAPNDEAMI